MNHGCFRVLDVGPEEYCGSEDSLEGRDQTAVLRTTLLHPERVEHFCCAPKVDRLALAAGRRELRERSEPVDPGPTNTNSVTE